MEYVILIHSPDPWGHPTSAYTLEGRAMPPERRAESNRQFGALLAELTAAGEFVGAEALGDPASSTLYGWGPSGPAVRSGRRQRHADPAGRLDDDAVAVLPPSTPERRHLEARARRLRPADQSPPPS